MKSTMKSAFAIIAVALMIMVAVVPMVGVFTEESDAATIIVPDTTKSITVSGTVMDSDSQKIKDVLVKAANGTYYEYGLTGSDGKYSITVNYSGTSINSLVVSIVTDVNEYEAQTGSKANPVDTTKFDSASQTISSVAGNISGIDFMSGYVAITGKLTYANTANAYDKSASVTAETVVTEGVATTYNGSFDTTTGIYTILVPINSGKMTVSAGDDFATKEINVAKANVTSGTDLANKTTYKAFVVYDVSDSVNQLTASAGTGIALSDFAAVKIDGEYAGKYSFTYTFNPDGDKKITISDTLGYGYAQDMTLSTSPSNYTFKENAYISGTIKMGNVLMTEAVASNLEIAYYKDSTLIATGPAGVGKSILLGVYTISFGKVSDFGEVNKVIVTYKIDANTTASTISTSIPSKTGSAGTTANIAFKDTGYYLISGTIKNGTTPAELVKVGVSSTGAVGVNAGEVYTDLSGKYSFYAKSGENVTITPADATFIPSSQIFKAIAAKTVDFTMDSHKLTSTASIQDAAGNALKGVTVKYKITEFGTYADATLNNDSTFSVNVRSDVSVDEIYVYFEKAGYTFSATVDNPVKMNATEFKANEQTLTFEVKDAANQPITNISGISFQVAKYKIHAVSPQNNAFDMIGSLSNVTYDAATGKFSFIAEKLDGAADSYGYETQYGISVKSNTTEYTFTTITEFADSLTIKANEQTFTGKVTDAAAGTAKDLKGMTVAVYESSDASAAKISADVTTLNDGSFSIVSEAGYVKVTDPNGVYTFTGAATSSLTGPIKANEQTYTGSVKDADTNLVKNANITVKVIDADGKTVGSVATVGKLTGTYNIITKLAEGSKIIATDADGVRTFEAVTIASGVSALDDVVSGQCTISGVVKTKTSATPIKDITVTLSIYSTTVDPVVVDTAVTDSKGKYSFFVDEKSGYGVVATDSGIYLFNDEKVTVSSYTANIETLYDIKTVTVKDNYGTTLSGIAVTIYDGDDIVGEYVSDADGKIKFPGITDVTFEAVDPNGVYTFSNTLTSDSLFAKEKTYSATVKSYDEGYELEGITVNFISSGKTVKTAITDKNGAVSVVLDASASYKVSAVDGKTAYGAVTFGDATDYASSLVIKAKESIYSGYYANGDVVSGVKVTYEMSKDGKFVEKGDAAVIDNKYYIATDVTQANKIVVTATASGFSASGEFNTLGDIGSEDLDIAEKKGIVKVEDSTGFFRAYYEVYNATNAQVGDKIILRAQNVAYKPLEDDNSTTVVKYTFNGWYVNGVKVSDDLEYTYTVTEECIVYADYKVSSYETEPSQGVDSTVLVIGIAAVIIALIAVVYAVIQKKE